MYRIRHILAALSATVALATILAVSALASRFEISSQTWRATWTTLNFRASFFGFPITIRCPVTTEGSLHSRVTSKVVESLAGYVTSAIVNSARCEGGTATILTAHLPWHIRYASFSGTLPNISSIKEHVIGNEFRVEAVGLVCLYTSSATEPVVGIVELSAGTVASLTAEIGVSIRPIAADSASCGPSRLEGRSAVENRSGASITVRLVQ